MTLTNGCYNIALILQVNGKKKVGVVEMNGISVTTQEGIIIIDKGSELKVTYSLSQEIIVTTSDAMTGKLCGACGNLTGKEPSVNSKNINTYMNLYRAADFPSW